MKIKIKKALFNLKLVTNSKKVNLVNNNQNCKI